MAQENLLPYKCKHCSDEFKDVNEAKIHFINAHIGDQPFKVDKENEFKWKKLVTPLI